MNTQVMATFSELRAWAKLISVIHIIMTATQSTNKISLSQKSTDDASIQKVAPHYNQK